MRAAVSRVAPLLLALAVTACAAGQQHVRDPQPATFVQVNNQNFLDMTIYAYRSSQRVRIGTAGGNSTTRLRIPSTIIFGATPLRFQADPVGSRASAMSFEITVSPGDEVTLTIPPR